MLLSLVQATIRGRLLTICLHLVSTTCRMEDEMVVAQLLVIQNERFVIGRTQHGPERPVRFASAFVSPIFTPDDLYGER